MARKAKVRPVEFKPVDVKGTHLTITYINGQPKFEWDWDKLTQEINDAIGNLTPKKKKRGKTK